MKLRHSAILLLACACGLIGCAAPKAPDTDTPATPAPKTEVATVPTPPTVPDDGLRIGNLTELPKDTEYRPTNPPATAETRPGTTVIVTPPPVPKPRPKPE
jgi:hypothetical protein